ncbi:MAG: VWA domain-containing protein [Victivallales bacterium]|nr:VWA domain-containing protein [Victivallales bacterium]
MIYLNHPLFFIALAALALLPVIYFLFRRSRRKTVSSLMLWENQLKSRKSGMVFKRLPLPLTFLVEVLIIIFLTLAAVGFMLSRAGKTSPLTLVLDDSFSMRAGAPSPKEKSLERIRRMLRDFPGRETRIIFAGRTVRSAGSFSQPAQVLDALEKWDCENPSADLKTALALAKKLNIPKGRIQVFTDHLPWQNEFDPEISWNALGTPLDNTAIITAARSSRAGGRDRCMLIIANLSDKAVNTTLTIEFPGSERKALSQTLTLPAGKERKVSVDMPAGTGDAVFSLGADELEFDNRVVLMPERSSPLRVQLDIQDENTAAMINKAISGVGHAVLSPLAPQLVISDKPETAGTVPVHHLIFLPVPEGKSFSGPYTVNRTHPVSDGIDLKGVVWGADPAVELEGSPLILVGNTPLISLVEKHSGAKVLYMLFDPARSTLQHTPNWPVLFWNLTGWLADIQPGMRRCNHRAGVVIDFRTPRGVSRINLIDPHGKSSTLNTSAGRLISADVPGRYSLKLEGSDEQKYRNYEFQVNPLNYNESDLRRCRTELISKPGTFAEMLKDYIDISWIFMLAALTLLLWHWYLIRRTD